MGARGVLALRFSPPGAAALSGGGGTSPWLLGGVEGRRLQCPSPASRDPEGGEWKEKGGGVSPCFLATLPRGVGLWPPASAPLHGRRRGAAHPTLLHARPGLCGSPGRRAGSGWPLVGQSGGGGGVVGAPPLLRGSAGGARGAGGGKVALLRSISPPSRAGTKAGCFVIAPPSKLR